MLHDNGRDYHILVNATKNIKGIEGLTCEVGLREGGGSKYIIDTLLNNEDLGRTHIAIDPYGSIPYIQSEKQVRGGKDSSEEIGPYPNSMMKYTLSELYGYVYKKDIELLFFPLEDTEFFSRYSDGIPIYKNGQKSVENKYAITYLDGPHNLDSTMREAKFFGERTPLGGIMVFDDVSGYYDHDVVRKHILTNGWQELEFSGTKISYKKMSE